MTQLNRPLTALALLTTSLVAVGAANAQHGYHNSGQGLILFDKGDYRGERRFLDQDVDTLRRVNFNDRIQSVAVLEGTWELCEDRNFKGRCIVVRDDVYRLKDFGLGDRITSIRRLSDYADVPHLTLVERDYRGEISYVYDDPYYYADSGYTSYGPYTYYSTSVFYGRDFYGAGPYGYYDHGYGYRHGHRDWYRHGYRKPWYDHGYYHYDKPKAPAHIGPKNANVTIWADPGMRGRSFGVNDAIPSFGDAGFNDIASSITIKSGTWEICDQSYYRGRCKIVDVDQHSLAGLRLNDNISSIRPVGDYTPPPKGKGKGKGRGKGDGHNGGGYKKPHKLEAPRRQISRGTDTDVGERRRIRKFTETGNDHDRLLRDARSQQRANQQQRDARERLNRAQNQRDQRAVTGDVQRDQRAQQRQQAQERARRQAEREQRRQANTARQNAEAAQRRMTASEIQRYRDQAAKAYQRRQTHEPELKGRRDQVQQRTQTRNVTPRQPVVRQAPPPKRPNVQRAAPRKEVQRYVPQQNQVRRAPPPPQVKALNRAQPQKRPPERSSHPNRNVVRKDQ